MPKNNHASTPSFSISSHKEYQPALSPLRAKDADASSETIDMEGEADR